MSATCSGATTSRTPKARSPTRGSWCASAFKDVPPGETRRILGLNAVELYGIDAAALAPLVDRIGPRVDEIHSDTPLATVVE